MRKCKSFATRKVNANMKRTLLLALPLLLCSCGEPSSSKPTIVASFYPISFLASQIAGEKYEVVNLTPPGSEPHDFELTPRNVVTMTDAKMILLNGLGMEAYEDSLNDSLKQKTYVLSQGIATKTIEGRVDPHIWLDTNNYEAMGQNVLNTLTKIDSENADYYRSNFTLFSKKMADLRKYCTQIANQFEHKTIAVNHAAFGYLCAEWGIEQLYINALSPDEEPTQKAIEEILQAIESKGIDTVFFEELASDAVAKKIASETHAKTESLNPLEGLTQADLNKGKDYFSVYQENMDKIARAKP